MSEELLKINYDNDRPTVSGRELHNALGIETRYNDWFARMCDYGFVEGKDFYSFLSNRSDGLTGRPRCDHQLTVPMAKEICMIQRSDKGREYRQYFLKVEAAWNSPEAVLARAVTIAKKQLDSMEGKMTQLEAERGEHLRQIEEQSAQLDRQAAQLKEQADKVSYCDAVLHSYGAVAVTVMAADYGMSAQEMNALLKKLKVQRKVNGTWVLYRKYQQEGYTTNETCWYPRNSRFYHVSSYTTMRWTQKGRLFVYELLKEQGILPLSERGEQEDAITDGQVIPIAAAM